MNFIQETVAFESCYVRLLISSNKVMKGKKFFSYPCLHGSGYDHIFEAFLVGHFHNVLYLTCELVDVFLCILFLITEFR